MCGIDRRCRNQWRESTKTMAREHHENTWRASFCAPVCVPTCVCMERAEEGESGKVAVEESREEQAGGWQLAACCFSLFPSSPHMLAACLCIYILLTKARPAATDRGGKGREARGRV
jgi:hypothetical protein